MTELVGRLHPLLVHLPIGILLFAAGLMIYGRFRKATVDTADRSAGAVDTASVDTVVSLAWVCGALSALLACGTGWLLAQSGEYDATMVAKHQWMGLATAGLAVLTCLLKRHRWPVGLLTVGVLTIAGHYGGNLTHGEDYLFPRAKRMAETEPTRQPAPITEALASAEPADSVNTANKPLVRRTFLYRDQVVPILKTRCYSCHSASKKKGKLRLDSEDFIRQGGKNGPILVVGNPAKSKLFSYLLLPEGDEQHMPPKGKLQLSPQQIAVIHHWIQKGASFTGQTEVIPVKTAAEMATVAEVIPPLPPLVQTDLDNPAVPGDASPLLKVSEAKAQSIGLESALLTRPIDAPNPTAMAKLKHQQVALSNVVGGANYLSANFVNVKTFGPTLLADLTGVGPQVVHLKLSGQPVSDADLHSLAVLKNLTRLNLDNTSVTDAGLTVLPDLPNLEQLNLYGTAVTDAGLPVLARCSSLKIVYLWQTQTTPAGIRQLQKSRPDLKIDAGTLQLTRPDVARPDTSKAL